MTAELVKRLRDEYPEFIAFTNIKHIAIEAADAIEALQATVTVREGQANHWQEIAQQAQAERDQLQAKLDELAKQEPVGKVCINYQGAWASLKGTLKEGDALYAAPKALEPLTDERKEAMAVYTPPFKYQHGYIFDSQQHMVADDDKVEEAVAARIRGWGKLSYLPNGAAIQDELGKTVADALTAYYAAHGITKGTP